LIRTAQEAKPNERIEQQKEMRGEEKKVEKGESLSNKLQES
jgi:Reverse transcriptase (RNA-dependent DNA polymerase)